MLNSKNVYLSKIVIWDLGILIIASFETAEHLTIGHSEAKRDILKAQKFGNWTFWDETERLVQPVSLSSLCSSKSRRPLSSAAGGSAASELLSEWLLDLSLDALRWLASVICASEICGHDVSLSGKRISKNDHAIWSNLWRKSIIDTIAKVEVSRQLDESFYMSLFASPDSGINHYTTHLHAILVL